MIAGENVYHKAIDMILFVTVFSLSKQLSSQKKYVHNRQTFSETQYFLFSFDTGFDGCNKTFATSKEMCSHSSQGNDA